MPSEYITDQTGRYVRLKWRRDANGPGHVQIATGAPGVDGEFVDLDERAVDKLIKGLHKAKNQALGTAPEFHPGGPVLPSHPLMATLDHDEHVLRDVTEQGDPERMYMCAREDHAGRRCQAGRYTWAEVTAEPQPIRFKAPEVTVESDATAAARLDTDRYRATRRGDR